MANILKTERGGFEPPSAFTETHFECVTINHSDTSPRELIQFILEYYTTAMRRMHPLPSKSIAIPGPIATAPPRFSRASAF
jgi:predicted site-specific integrase-resolvase